jgi:Uma2 family endonuclease
MLAGNGERTLREMADELLEWQRVEFIHDGGLTFVATPGRAHRMIVTQLTKTVNYASFAGLTPVQWDVSAGDFQFEWNDAARHYCVPDLAIAFPNSASNAEFRENLAMVVEVTSPKSPEAVENDFEIKYKQYAKGGVPLYLVVDQELSDWHLYALMGRWPGYQVYAEGVYGDPIELPEPFSFDLPTAAWPRYSSKDD